MRLGAGLFRDQRVGSFLHSVMNELVGTIETIDQLLAQSIPQSRVYLLLGLSQNERKHRDVGDAAEASKLPQRVLRFEGKPRQLSDHQVHYIVGVSLGVNAVEIAVPARSIMVKDEHSFVGERRNELNGEERIATRLLVHQLRERRDGFRRAANSVGNQLPNMLSGERPKRDLDYCSASGLDCVEFAHERMRGSDFVIAVGAYEENIAEIGSAQQVFHEVERRGIEPLQIIEEKRQGMFRPSEDADKLSKHQLETPLRVLWRKLRDRRWRSDNELHFRNEIHNQSCVRSQRLPQRVAPGREVGFTFAEQRLDQALKGLCQSR